MNQAQIWLEATRPKTLPAAFAPVLLGTALALSSDQARWLPAAICLVFALLVQIGTNFANDYLDGIKGTDTNARIGPRRAVASGLISASSMRLAAMAVLAFAFCLGLSLIYYGGVWLLAVGVASVACAWLYTGGPYPLAYNGLGDVFVVLFFGLIAVGCTFFVQTGSINADVVLVGFVCGLIVNNILVVNNYRDLDEDRLARKRTLVVMFGRRWALVQYALSLVLACLVPVWLALSGYSNFVLLGCAVSVSGALQLKRLSIAQTPEDFSGVLQGTAKIVILYSLLVSGGLTLGQ